MSLELEAKPALLLARPNPVRGESWGGFLMRLAAANQLVGVGQLASVFKLRVQELLASDPGDFLRRRGINWNCEESEHGKNHGAGEGRIHLASVGRSKRTRICALCLRDDDVPYIRAHWDLPISLTCEVHDVMLADSCAACGSHLTFLRSSITQCRCGMALAPQVPRLPPGWVRVLKRVFSEAEVAAQAVTFRRATPKEQLAARVCQWLAERSRRNRRSGRIRVSASFLGAEVTQDIEGLFEDWPRKLAQSLECEVDRTNWRGYTNLSRRLGGTAFSAMREVVSELKGRFSRGERPSIVNKAGSLHRGTRATFGIKDLMRSTGHAYSSLVACIDAGVLPGASYEIDATTGRNRFTVPAELYWSLDCAYRQTNSVRDTAVQLGCDEHVILGLVAAGYLRKRVLLPSGYKFRLDPVGAAAFAKMMFAKAISDYRGESLERIYFSWWVPGPVRRGGLQRWGLIIDSIQKDCLPLFTACESPSALNSLFVRSSDLASIIRR